MKYVVKDKYFWKRFKYSYKYSLFGRKFFEPVYPVDLFKGLSYRVVVSNQFNVSLFAADNLKKNLHSIFVEREI